jgi:hypothetical protein
MVTRLITDSIIIRLFLESYVPASTSILVIPMLFTSLEMTMTV